jgi:class 3 adenylate cyclase
MIDAVHRYDGYVVQSTGDGIFALFGAPVAHEDHPSDDSPPAAASSNGRALSRAHRVSPAATED